MSSPSSALPVLICGDRELRLDQPRVMGILNVTPDSFSDGGRFRQLDAALVQAESMLEAGADIIDIGGESTRPDAAAVGDSQELDRVIPVIESLASRVDAILSIDTSKASVMTAAAAAGVHLINDVRALQEPAALQAAVAANLPVCLMHMQGQPRTMQASPEYRDVVQQVGDFLRQRQLCCIQAGIPKDQILLDPGFGFGKTLQHNIDLLRNLASLAEAGPVLTGLSRKRMLGQMLGDDEMDRTSASVAAAMLCVQKGACIVRVHDVAPTVQALRILQQVQAPGQFAVTT